MGLDAENMFYIIDELIAQEINGSEGVNFNSAFYGSYSWNFCQRYSYRLG